MIGIDIVENSRMTNKDEQFIKRILSDKEQEKFNSFNSEDRKIQYLASRFAAKEAIFKVFKEGKLDFNYNDISILNHENGSPYIIMKNEIKTNLEISISHEKNYSVAIVMKTK
ncbi:MAG: holo-ACP synthase [bacterium]